MVMVYNVNPALVVFLCVYAFMCLCVCVFVCLCACVLLCAFVCFCVLLCLCGLAAEPVSVAAVVSAAEEKIQELIII